MRAHEWAKKFNHESRQCFYRFWFGYKTDEDHKVPEDFLGVHGNYLFLQEFSRALEENFKNPGVFQEIQEFSKKSRSSEHHISSTGIAAEFESH